MEDIHISSQATLAREIEPRSLWGLWGRPVQREAVALNEKFYTGWFRGDEVGS